SVSGNPGKQTLLYTLTYGNHGGQASGSVVIDEHVPFLTRFRQDGSDHGWTCDPPLSYAALGGRGSCHPSLGTIGPGQSGTATFEVGEGETEIPVASDFPIYNRTEIAGQAVDANAADNAYDLATPDVLCGSNPDPIQYLLCLSHASPASRSWLA